MDFELQGYEVNCIGGGVAMYVDKNLNYKVVDSKVSNYYNSYYLQMKQIFLFWGKFKSDTN